MSYMKRILILTDGHLPVPAVQGGAVPTLVESLILVNEKYSKYNFVVVSKYDSNAELMAKRLKNTKIIYIKRYRLCQIVDSLINTIAKIILPRNKRRDLDLFWKFKIIYHNKKLLLTDKFDAVVIENHGFLTKSLNDRKLLDQYHGRLYFHLHNEIPNSVSKNVEPYLEYILISKYLSKNILRKYGNNSKDRIYILKNGIDISNIDRELTESERSSLRKQYGFSETDYVVCFVGRITEEKGILQLLEAFRIIEDNQIKLIIAGSTEFDNKIHSKFEENILNICNELGNRVCATGYIKHDDIWKIYQLSDIAVLPSIWEEPAGLTILEAMSNGIPVITTDAGGIPEYMSPEFGKMVQRGETLPRDIAASIMLFYKKNRMINKENEKQYIKSNYSREIYFERFADIISRGTNDEKY